MEPADGDGVIQQDAMVGDIDHIYGELPSFAKRAACGCVEGGVDGQVRAVVGALIRAGKAV